MDIDEHNRQLGQQVWLNNNRYTFTVLQIQWTELEANGQEVNYVVENRDDFFKNTVGVVVDYQQKHDGSVHIVVEVMPK